MSIKVAVVFVASLAVVVHGWNAVRYHKDGLAIVYELIIFSLLSTIAAASCGALGISMLMKDARKKDRKPTVEMVSSPENHAILDAVPQLTSPVLPPWGRNAWVTTSIFTSRNAFPNERGNLERVDLPDGGHVTLDWYCDTNPKENGVILLCPGLNNSSRDYYLVKLAEVLTLAGFNVVGLNYRGVLSQLSSIKFGGADSWHDLPFVLRRIGEHTCDSDGDIKNLKLYGVGCSMGGAILSRYILEQEKENDSTLLKGMPTIPKIRAQVLVCAPIGMSHVSRVWDETWTGTAISIFIATGLKFKLIAQQWGSTYFWKAMNEIGLWNWFTSLQLKDIDALWTPINGWATHRDYYEACSSQDYIGKSENGIPSLLIASRDDPVVHPDAARPPHPIGKKVIYVETDAGGHLAFGSQDLGWVNKAVRNYFLHIAGSP